MEVLILFLQQILQQLFQQAHLILHTKVLELHYVVCTLMFSVLVSFNLLHPLMVLLVAVQILVIHLMIIQMEVFMLILMEKQFIAHFVLSISHILISIQRKEILYGIIRISINILLQTWIYKVFLLMPFHLVLVKYFLCILIASK